MCQVIIYIHEIGWYVSSDLGLTKKNCWSPGHSQYGAWAFHTLSVTHNFLSRVDVHQIPLTFGHGGTCTYVSWRILLTRGAQIIDIPHQSAEYQTTHIGVSLKDTEVSKSLQNNLILFMPFLILRNLFIFLQGLAFFLSHFTRVHPSGLTLNSYSFW